MFEIGDFDNRRLNKMLAKYRKWIVDLDFNALSKLTTHSENKTRKNLPCNLTNFLYKVKLILT